MIPIAIAITAKALQLMAKKKKPFLWFGSQVSLHHDNQCFDKSGAGLKLVLVKPLKV